jgi:beta-N-acetylhexosaminidase
VSRGAGLPMVTTGRLAVLTGACVLVLTAAAGTTASARPASPQPEATLTGFTESKPAVTEGSTGDPIRDRVNEMRLIDRVRSLMVLPFDGTAAPTGRIGSLHPGGLIYFSANLTSQAQTKALSSAIQHATVGETYPMLLMTDQEGHPVTRIPGTEDTPGGIEFHGDAAWAKATAQTTGALMSRLLVNTDLAPVSDVNTAGAGGVIGGRSFGSNRYVVSRLVTAQVCGYHAGGVATTAKHFPGHGSTNTDSHLHTAVIHESIPTWEATDLPPFEAAVRNHVDMILVGHLAFPAMDPSGRPATISRTLNHDLIRDRLGYEGVVITDALNMGGVTSWGTNAQIAIWALKAGNDMLLMPPQPVVAIQAIYHAVLNGQLAEGRVDGAAYRVLKLKQRLGLLIPHKRLPQCAS